MRYPRRLRFVAALVALVSLLFTQVALAAYDCPQQAAVLAQAAAMQQTQAIHHDCCTPHDKQSPNLCDAHRHADIQTPDSAAQPAVAPFVQAALVLEVSSFDAALPLTPEEPAAFLQAPGSSPPITIRHCCLRN